jgi:catecholate siderophore receptor
MKRSLVSGSSKKKNRRLSTLALANVIALTGASKAATPATSESGAASKPSSVAPATKAKNKAKSAETGASVGAADREDRLAESLGVLVTAKPLDSYDTDTSANVKLTDPIRDTPQTIRVIPQSLIKDQNASSLQQALQNVPGITFVAGEGGTLPGDNINIRGFNARQDLFVDGFRDTGVYTRDPFNLEQIEVVEGPASTYSGHGSTGGSINLISKAPMLTPLYGATIGFGSDLYFRDTVDINQPLTKWLPNTAIRFNGVYQYNEFAGRDEVNASRWGLNPSIAYGIGANFRATLSYLFLREEDLPSFGLPTINATAVAANPQFANNLNEVAPVDYSNFYGLTGRDYQDSTTHIPTLTLAYDFNENFKLLNTTRYGETFVDEITTPPRFSTGINFLPGGGLAGNYTLATYPADTMTRELRGRRQRDTFLGNQTALTAKFDTWKFHHDAVLTMEFIREQQATRTATGVNVITSLSNPNPDDPYAFPVIWNPETKTRLDNFAFSLFDSIKLLPQLILSGSMRYDHLEANAHVPATATLPAFEGERIDDLVSWRTGLTYKPIEPVSVYFGYGTSYNPSIEGNTGNTSSPTSLNSSTSQLEPEFNQTFEFGVKWEAIKDKLTLNTAFFRTLKDNARIADPSLPSTSGVFVLDGEVRVQGIEFAIQGNITKEWKVFGGYTYLESEFLSGPNAGRELPYTPNQSASIFTTYDLPYHFTVGFGSRFYDKIWGSALNTTSAPGYHLEQAMINYQATKNVGVQINVYNLTDEEYIAQYGNGGAIPGSGRSVTCTVDLKF